MRLAVTLAWRGGPVTTAQQLGTFEYVGVELDGHIAQVEIQRPPHNYFSIEMLRDIADAYAAIERETDARVIVLAAQGRSFCAGAQLGRAADPSEAPPAPGDRDGRRHLYTTGLRIMDNALPVVGAIQGPAIGGGLGLALTPDFRVASPEAYFTANFARLGFHQGFGLTATLPAIVGQQVAWRMFMTGERIAGEEALRVGLCDALAPLDGLRARAFEFANEIAKSAPLSVRTIRRTLRRGLIDRVRVATVEEAFEQDWIRQMEDFREGVRATAERREPNFTGT
jgi:enoyl-CoA hydratase/carnithine racemase